MLIKRNPFNAGRLQQVRKELEGRKSKKKRHLRKKDEDSGLVTFKTGERNG